MLYLKRTQNDQNLSKSVVGDSFLCSLCRETLGICHTGLCAGNGGGDAVNIIDIISIEPGTLLRTQTWWRRPATETGALSEVIIQGGHTWK